jgi:hypothetical protein
MSGFVLPGGPDHQADDEATSDEPTVRERLASLETLISDLANEVRTERLVVQDSEGRTRVVAEIVGGVTEVRLDVPGSPSGEGAALLLFATDGQDDTGSEAGVGIQLWIEGDEVAGYSTWRNQRGEWRTDRYVRDD